MTTGTRRPLHARAPSRRFAIRRAARPLAALAAAGLLAACTPGTSTGPVSIAPSYDRAYIADVAGRGGMPLVLKGDPFPGENGPFTQQVATALTEAHFGPEFTVFADPADAPDGSARTVLVVNAERRPNSGNVCRDGTKGGSPTETGALDFTIAFCSGTRRLSSTTGRFTGLSGPSDPRIAETFRRIAIQLYPPRNPDRGDQELLIN